MANRRMIDRRVIESDAFTGMPLSTQATYMHLVVNADDDGFLNNTQMIGRMIGATADDLRILFARGFLLDAGNGVNVVTHWRMMNAVKKDRYHPTPFQDSKKLLRVNEQGVYSFAESLESSEKTARIPSSEANGTSLEPEWNQNGTKMEPVWNQFGTSLEPEARLSKARVSQERHIQSGKPDDTAPNRAEEMREIVAHLNERAGTAFRPGSRATARHINARLAEGFTVSDFKAVIDTKCADWGKDPKMRKYLRPETLFGTKFESYLNQGAAERAAKEANPYADL